MTKTELQDNLVFLSALKLLEQLTKKCALPGFVDSKNEEKTERNAG